MEELILAAAVKYPVIFTIASVMGIVRMVLKPLMVFFYEYVAITPTEKDNEVLAKVESSKIYKAIIFLLDYVFSLKIPKK